MSPIKAKLGLSANEESDYLVMDQNKEKKAKTDKQMEETSKGTRPNRGCSYDGPRG